MDLSETVALPPSSAPKVEANPADLHPVKKQLIPLVSQSNLPQTVEEALE